MSVTVNITKRERHRKLKSGALVSHTRWVINYREPQTGKRRQLFFARAADAQVRRNAIVTEIGTGNLLGKPQVGDDRRCHAALAREPRG